MEHNKNISSKFTSENNISNGAQKERVKYGAPKTSPNGNDGVLNYYIKKRKSNNHYLYYLAARIQITGKRTTKNLESFGRESPVRDKAISLAENALKSGSQTVKKLFEDRIVFPISFLACQHLAPTWDM